MVLEVDRIICGDAQEVLTGFPEAVFDLVVTSPPYADQRANVYGGIHPDKYVEWFLPVGRELKRVLKKEGSFVLNIKERVVNGERHTYVLELIMALRAQGWLWTEEYCWHKRNCYPGKWPNRFRDAWERCLHFTKDKEFKMFQEAVAVPIGGWAKKRLEKLSDTDKIRDESKSGSGFGKRIANWLGRENVLPTNVLYLATECSNKKHSAAFPGALPEWFIKLFTRSGDLILDPFVGSGTTAVVARKLGRHYVGIDINEDYCDLAKASLEQLELKPFQKSLLDG